MYIKTDVGFLGGVFFLGIVFVYRYQIEPVCAGKKHMK